MIDSRLYFAYADNMNEDIIRGICPGVSFEGVAELRGYRLVFNSQGQLTIIPDKSSSVWGIAWCLSTRDIHLLDQKEVETLGRFDKITRETNLLDGRKVAAFLYITEVGDSPVFNQGLLEVVLEQAYYWSLPSKYIEFLENMSDTGR